MTQAGGVGQSVGAARATVSTDPSSLMTVPGRAADSQVMYCTDGPHPPDPWLTPDQELMLELGWLELWHAVREESPPSQGSDSDR
jgi:hypothetical protein